MSVRTKMVLVALCLGICAPASANALPWEKGDADPKARGQKMVERIKAKRAELIRTRIGLSEEQSAQVLEVLERFDPRRRELMEKKRGLRKSMDQLFSSDSTDDAEYKRVLVGLQSMEDALHRLRTEQAAAIGEVVSPRFQLRILVALKRFQGRLQERRKHRRGNRAGECRGDDCAGERGGRRGARRGRR